MLLSLKSDHKKHISFLIEQTLSVFQDFCKLAIDYLQKGPSLRLYSVSAQKLEVDADIIQSSVEGLIYLLMESHKSKLSTEDFKNSVIALGFAEEKAEVLCKLYEDKKHEISEFFSKIGFKLPEYYNMEWRFEVQLASRTLLKQVTPLVTFHLTLKNSEDSNNLEHTLLQTDPNNLLHMVHELEQALQESRGQHIRQVSRILKQN